MASAADDGLHACARHVQLVRTSCHEAFVHTYSDQGLCITLSHALADLPGTFLLSALSRNQTARVRVLLPACISACLLPVFPQHGLQETRAACTQRKYERKKSRICSLEMTVSCLPCMYLHPVTCIPKAPTLHKCGANIESDRSTCAGTDMVETLTRSNCARIAKISGGWATCPRQVCMATTREGGCRRTRECLLVYAQQVGHIPVAVIITDKLQSQRQLPQANFASNIFALFVVKHFRTIRGGPCHVHDFIHTVIHKVWALKA
jgi:hypothetical protein